MGQTDLSGITWQAGCLPFGGKERPVHSLTAPGDPLHCSLPSRPTFEMGLIEAATVRNGAVSGFTESNLLCDLVGFQLFLVSGSN